MVHERDCRLATRGRLDPSQADSVAHCSRRRATGGIKTNFKREKRERSTPPGMNNAMIDKNNQLLERDNKQDTGEETSNVSNAEDPSRSSYRPMPNVLKNQNTEVSHNPKRMEHIDRIM